MLYCAHYAIETGGTFIGFVYWGMLAAIVCLHKIAEEDLAHNRLPVEDVDGD